MMLDSVALFTQSALREMDLLARLDDGEFIVLLAGQHALGSEPDRQAAADVGGQLRLSAAE